MAKPVKFPGYTVVLAEDQLEYTPLPVMVLDDKMGTVISCHEFTDEEIDEIVRTRTIYISQCTFGGQFQPMFAGASLSDLVTLGPEE